MRNMTHHGTVVRTSALHACVRVNVCKLFFFYKKPTRRLRFGSSVGFTCNSSYAVAAHGRDVELRRFRGKDYVLAVQRVSWPPQWCKKKAISPKLKPVFYLTSSSISDHQPRWCKTVPNTTQRSYSTKLNAMHLLSETCQVNCEHELLCSLSTQGS